ncbi:MAG: hypothetical protein COA79_21960 [Planctomycetota bacterium]|nr:MAG: hypothetical protein COA79_21960 [Planctomycetota bacterium]
MKYLLIPLLALIVSCGDNQVQKRALIDAESKRIEILIKKVQEEQQRAHKEKMKKENIKEETTQKDDTEK